MSENDAETSGIPQLAKVVGAIVAPTTLVTSLLFYFGWMHAYWFFNYFGINSTLLGLSTEDYLMRSLDGLFVPLIVVACSGLLCLRGHGLLRTRLATAARGRLRRTVLRVLASIGAALALIGFPSVFTPTPLDNLVALPPLCLAVGVLLLAYVGGLRRQLQADSVQRRSTWISAAEWAGVFVLVGLSLFWAATDYSSAVGRSRARHLVVDLRTEPNTVVYSGKSLGLTAPGVRETRCDRPDAAFRYRYDGLKLLLQSGDQYVFLPAAWTPEHGVGVVLPRTDTIRLEFSRSSATSAQEQEPTC